MDRLDVVVSRSKLMIGGDFVFRCVAARDPELLRSARLGKICRVGTNLTISGSNHPFASGVMEEKSRFRVRVTFECSDLR